MLAQTSEASNCRWVVRATLQPPVLQLTGQAHLPWQAVRSLTVRPTISRTVQGTLATTPPR